MTSFAGGVLELIKSCWAGNDARVVSPNTLARMPRFISTDQEVQTSRTQARLPTLPVHAPRIQSKPKMTFRVLLKLYSNILLFVGQTSVSFDPSATMFVLYCRTRFYVESLREMRSHLFTKNHAVRREEKFFYTFQRVFCWLKKPRFRCSEEHKKKELASLSCCQSTTSVSIFCILSINCCLVFLFIPLPCHTIQRLVMKQRQYRPCLILDPQQRRRLLLLPTRPEPPHKQRRCRRRQVRVLIIALVP